MSTLPVREFLFAGWLALLAAPAVLAADPAASPDEKVSTAAATEENPIVCKRIAVTGSRVKKEKICRTQREWDTSTQRAKEFVRDVDRGNQPLPAGG